MREWCADLDPSISRWTLSVLSLWAERGDDENILSDSHREGVVAEKISHDCSEALLHF